MADVNPENEVGLGISLALAVFMSCLQHLYVTQQRGVDA